MYVSSRRDRERVAPKLKNSKLAAVANKNEKKKKNKEREEEKRRTEEKESILMPSVNVTIYPSIHSTINQSIDRYSIHA